MYSAFFFRFWQLLQIWLRHPPLDPELARIRWELLQEERLRRALRLF